MDDPLMKNIMLVKGMSGVVNVETPCDFQLDYTQYTVLVRASYNALTAFDRKIIRQLSYSMYQYYCFILLWKRMLFVIASHGKMCKEHLKMEECLGCDLPVPADVKLYLDGVGDYHDPCFGDFHLCLQAVLKDQLFNGAQGGYGRVDLTNHLMYETVPSILIALLKIRADIMLTDEEPGFVEDWDLPGDLRPEDTRATLPNHNLLGWSKAELLSEAQRGLLIQSGISCRNFNVLNVGLIPVNTNLMVLVASALEGSTNRAFDICTSSTYGSMAQVPFSTRVPRDTVPTVYRPVTAKIGQTCSYTMLSRHMASAAATFRYRVDRRGKTGSEDTLCYRFATAPPPQEWLQNENEVFEFGAGKLLWNNRLFYMNEMQGDFLASSLAQRVRHRFPNDN